MYQINAEVIYTLKMEVGCSLTCSKPSIRLPSGITEETIVYIIYCLFNDAVSSTDYAVLNDGIGE